MTKYKFILRMSKKEKGAYAESLAAHIYDKNYRHRILYQNLHLKFGEIDLITSYQNYTYVVEVKSTTNHNFGESFSRWRRGQRRRLAAALKELCVLGIIKDLAELKVEFIVFDFSMPDKVRFKRYTNIPLGI